MKADTVGNRSVTFTVGEFYRCTNKQGGHIAALLSFVNKVMFTA
jgi:hypothetical protein